MPKKVAYALAGIGIAAAVLIILVLSSVISISFLLLAYGRISCPPWFLLLSGWADSP